MTTAADRLDEIRRRIALAAARAGRTPDAVRLIAVSKRHSAEAVCRLAELGVTDFGESQIQEAMHKIPQCGRAGLAWHFIGHLQSNKTRHVPAYFNWVHSVDSLKLARRIDEAATALDKQVRILIQVNVAQDPAKHGVATDKLFALLDAIMSAQLAGITLSGLMTIGLRNAGEDQARAGFAMLRQLLDASRERFGPGFSELSMGMSDDFTLAIEEGATLVRVGSALFGPRD